MLKIQNLYAGYGDDDIVKDISFQVKPNENLSIIGPNGCGKTTLLKAMINLLPYKGEVIINGTSVNKMKQHEIARQIAILSQSSEVYFSYSVFDTVMMGRYVHRKDRLLGKPSNEDKEIVIQCLSAVNLLPVKDDDITKLSGGQLQRVFLARTLAQQPQVILLDEPTNHLDLKYQIELIEYLKEWSAKDNHAVIGVLHDMNHAMRLSENIMVMKDGMIAAYGKVGEAVTNKLLQEVYEIDVAGYMKESLTIWEELDQ